MTDEQVAEKEYEFYWDGKWYVIPEELGKKLFLQRFIYGIIPNVRVKP